MKRNCTVYIPRESEDGTVYNTEISSTYGKAINITNGTLTLGNDNYNVYNDYPQIIGGKQGIYISGQGRFNMYDGIIKSIQPASIAYEGVVSGTPEIHSLNFEDETNMVAYLKIIATANKSCLVEDTYYSLEGAIKSINDRDEENKTGTIILQENVDVDKTMEILANNNVTINLNGFSIRGANSENPTIRVCENATLTIIDEKANSEKYSCIQNYYGTAIENNGTLNIGTSDKEPFANSPRIIGETYAIENSSNGTLNMYTGTLEGKTEGLIKGNTTINIPNGIQNINDKSRLNFNEGCPV